MASVSSGVTVLDNYIENLISLQISGVSTFWKGGPRSKTFAWVVIEPNVGTLAIVPPVVSGEAHRRSPTWRTAVLWQRCAADR
jgi:hypothetical protein